MSSLSLDKTKQGTVLRVRSHVAGRRVQVTLPESRVVDMAFANVADPCTALTVTSAGERWFSERVDLPDQYKPAESKRKRILWGRYIAPHLGDKLVTALSRSDVSRWIALCAAPDEDGNPPAASTVRGPLMVLSAFLEWCGVIGLRTDNPARGQGLAKPRRADDAIRVLTPDECVQILEYCDSRPAPLGSLVRLTLLTGMRRGEVVALRAEDLDLSKRIAALHVRRAVSDGVVTVPKAGRGRVITPSKQAVAAFEERVGECRRLYGAGWDGTLFPVHRGDRDGASPYCSPAWFTRQLTAAFQTLDIDAGVHDLRHTHATLLAEAGVSVDVIKEALGHSDEATTLRYVHLAKQRDKQLEAAEAFSRAIDPTSRKPQAPSAHGGTPTSPPTEPAVAHHLPHDCHARQ